MMNTQKNDRSGLIKTLVDMAVAMLEPIVSKIKNKGNGEKGNRYPTAMYTRGVSLAQELRTIEAHSLPKTLLEHPGVTDVTVKYVRGNRRIICYVYDSSWGDVEDVFPLITHIRAGYYNQLKVYACTYKDYKKVYLQDPEDEDKFLAALDNYEEEVYESEDTWDDLDELDDEEEEYEDNFLAYYLPEGKRTTEYMHFLRNRVRPVIGLMENENDTGDYESVYGAYEMVITTLSVVTSESVKLNGKLTEGIQQKVRNILSTFVNDMEAMTIKIREGKEQLIHEQNRMLEMQITAEEPHLETNRLYLPIHEGVRESPKLFDVGDVIFNKEANEWQVKSKVGDKDGDEAARDGIKQDNEGTEVKDKLQLYGNLDLNIDRVMRDDERGSEEIRGLLSYKPLRLAMEKTTSEGRDYENYVQRYQHPPNTELTIHQTLSRIKYEEDRKSLLLREKYEEVESYLQKIQQKHKEHGTKSGGYGIHIVEECNRKGREALRGRESSCLILPKRSTEFHGVLGKVHNELKTELMDGTPVKNLEFSEVEEMRFQAWKRGHGLD